MVQIHSFVCGYPVVLASFIEKTVLSPIELCWHICPKLINHKCKGLFLESQFCSIGLCVSCHYHSVLITIAL